MDRVAKLLGWIVLTAAVFALGLFSAVVQAWCMSVVWRWFVAPQYGAGPTLAVWFGLTIILRMMIAASTMRLKKAEPEHSPLYDAFTDSLAIIFAFLMTLGLAWITGSIVGWL